MKRATKVFGLILLMLVCSIACTACAGIFGGKPQNATSVDCTVGEWKKVNLNVSGTTFFVTLDAPAPIYFKTDKLESSYTHSFKNEAGEVIERNVLSKGDLPAGKYGLQIIPKSANELEISVQFYNSSSSIAGGGYIFGEETPYNKADEITPSGNWYKFTLTEEKFVLLTLDDRNTDFTKWLYFDAEVYRHDLKTSVLSKSKMVAVLAPDVYYINVRSSSKNNKTNGRIVLSDVREIAQITQDTISESNSIATMGANLYFNNEESGHFAVKLVDPQQKPRMSVYNAVGERVVFISGTEPAMTDLPKGEYFVHLEATTQYIAESKVLFAKATDVKSVLKLDEPLPEQAYSASGKWFSLAVSNKTQAYISSSADLEIFINGKATEESTYLTLEVGEYTLWIVGKNAGTNSKVAIQSVSPTENSLALDGSSTIIDTDFGKSKWFEVDLTKLVSRTFVFSVIGQKTAFPFAILDKDFKTIRSERFILTDVDVTTFMPSNGRSTGFACTVAEEHTKVYFLFSSDTATQLSMKFTSLENIAELAAGEETVTVLEEGYFAKVNIDGFGVIAVHSASASFEILSGGKKTTPNTGNGVANTFVRANLSGTTIIYISNKYSSNTTVAVQAIDFKNAEQLAIGQEKEINAPNKMFFAKISVEAAGVLSIDELSHQNTEYNLYDSSGNKVGNSSYTYAFKITAPGTYYLMLTKTELNFSITPNFVGA